MCTSITSFGISFLLQLSSRGMLLLMTNEAKWRAIQLIQPFILVPFCDTSLVSESDSTKGNCLSDSHLSSDLAELAGFTATSITALSLDFD